MDLSGNGSKLERQIIQFELIARGRYIQASNLEDCRRWRIVVLCKLVSNDNNEERFARLNLLWQCLAAPQPRVPEAEWVQWGGLHVEVISPGRDHDHLHLRGVRGKQTRGDSQPLHCRDDDVVLLGGAGGKAYSVFLGDHGKMMIISTDPRHGLTAVHLPGEPHTDTASCLRPSRDK